VLVSPNCDEVINLSAGSLLETQGARGSVLVVDDRQPAARCLKSEVCLSEVRALSLDNP
jgi:hypothetical protein